MKCVGCGKDIAQAAHFCTHCGAAQPPGDARTANVAVEAIDAIAQAPAATGAPKRGGSIAFVIGILVAVGLVALAAWRVLYVGSEPHDLQAVGEASMRAAPGQVPPPANQSAAPIPFPGALPPVDDGQPVASLGGSDASGVDTSKVEESVPAATPAPGAPAGGTTDANSAASGKLPKRPSRPAHPVAPKAAGAPAEPAVAAKAKVPAPAGTTAPAPAPMPDRWARMEEDMAKCTREDFINRVICAQRVKFRYCGGYWGKVPQCPGSPPSDNG